jgi:hypothetical protein
MYDKQSSAVNGVVNRSSTLNDLVERLILSGVAEGHDQALHMALTIQSDASPEEKDFRLATAGYDLSDFTDNEIANLWKGYELGVIAFPPMGSA